MIASFLFYGWGEPRFVLAVFVTTILDFLLVRMMDKSSDPSKRKLFLILSLSVNVGLLFYFKYFNFFIDNTSSLLSVFGSEGIHMAKIILPIGISFFTFESITYAVDVYRRVHKPLENFWEYQMYIIFFPKLIAGPIVRYHDIADQINGHVNNETYDNKLSGFIRFTIGLAKKVFIANPMGHQADAIFNADIDLINTPLAWIGVIAYTFQIYFDFSGYSDMAIGIARILGFRIHENFNNPYISQSITEFWRRWHITLGLWMKNYLYIPLGGNRVTRSRLLFNLFLVFLVSGFWHGASWNFIFWGMYHGFFLVIERILAWKNIHSKIKPLNVLYSFLVVAIGWIFFRTENFDHAFAIVKKMCEFNMNYSFAFLLDPGFWFWFVVAGLFSFIALIPAVRTFQERILLGSLKQNEYLIYTAAAAFVYFAGVVYLSGGGFNPFIYFKF